MIENEEDKEKKDTYKDEQFNSFNNSFESDSR